MTPEQCSAIPSENIFWIARKRFSGNFSTLRRFKVLKRIKTQSDNDVNTKFLKILRGHSPAYGDCEVS